MSPATSRTGCSPSGPATGGEAAAATPLEEEAAAAVVLVVDLSVLDSKPLRGVAREADSRWKLVPAGGRAPLTRPLLRRSAKEVNCTSSRASLEEAQMKPWHSSTLRPSVRRVMVVKMAGRLLLEPPATGELSETKRAVFSPVVALTVVTHRTAAHSVSEEMGKKRMRLGSLTYCRVMPLGRMEI